jgi:hypothetical protein
MVFLRCNGNTFLKKKKSNVHKSVNNNNNPKDGSVIFIIETLLFLILPIPYHFFPMLVCQIFRFLLHVDIIVIRRWTRVIAFGTTKNSPFLVCRIFVSLLHPLGRWNSLTFICSFCHWICFEHLTVQLDRSFNNPLD